MNTDKPILFNPRSSVFIGGQHGYGLFQQLLSRRHNTMFLEG
jgi:hypothetical protein